jgi:DNA-binding MarR family transcriptional regulator
MQQTSLDAYETVDLNEMQLYALRLVSEHGPDTAENIAAKAGIDAKLIWKRYPELEDAGDVRRPGDTATNPSGRSGLVVHITEQGNARLRSLLVSA